MERQGSVRLSDHLELTGCMLAGVGLEAELEWEPGSQTRDVASHSQHLPDLSFTQDLPGDLPQEYMGIGALEFLEEQPAAGV